MRDNKCYPFFVAHLFPNMTKAIWRDFILYKQEEDDDQEQNFI